MALTATSILLNVGCRKANHSHGKTAHRYGVVADINIKHSDRDTFVFVTFNRLEHAEAGLGAKWQGLESQSWWTEDAIKGLDQSRAFGTGVIKAIGDFGP